MIYKIHVAGGVCAVVQNVKHDKVTAIFDTTSEAPCFRRNSTIYHLASHTQNNLVFQVSMIPGPNADVMSLTSQNQ